MLLQEHENKLFTKFTTPSSDTIIVKWEKIGKNEDCQNTTLKQKD